MSALMVVPASAGSAELPVTTSPAACIGEVTWAAGAGGVGKIVNVTAFEVPPPLPSVRVKTVTGMDAAPATSPDEIAALRPVGPAKIVDRGLPFQLTIEQGTKPLFAALLPFTPSVNAAAPAKALEGVSPAITGVGSGVVEEAIVNVDAVEASDGIETLETVIAMDPAKAVSSAEIAAVSCVGLTNVVGRGEPFQFTVSPLATKLVPFTVSVIPVGAHSGVVLDDVDDAESDVIVGSAIGNATALDTLPLAAGLATAT